ncbi:MAG: ADOP family duplicated permease [Candidatus Sulfopaludibacter sp.]|nr:ADOP family duplicated permease [Candidatus Sulfopaludibacter sp.]
MPDLRYALRVLLKSPGFALIAVFSLALGIGANTAIFSLLNAVSLRPLATVQPDRLVGLASIDARAQRHGFSYSTYEKIRAHQRAFSALFAWTDASVFTLEAGGSLFPGSALLAGEGFTATMPIRPVLGRGIAPDDGAVAVLGYARWRSSFHASPAALGKLIRIQGKPFTVIGVAPESFTDMEGAGAVDAVVPLAAFTSLDRQRESRNPTWEVTGRLRPGVTLDRARAELEALWPQVRPDAAELLVVESAASGAGFNFARMRFGYPLKLLLGMVGVLLLLASLNLATLLLARAEARQRETGIRLALGAGRGRILRQYLAESMMLALAGSAAGVLCAPWAASFLAQFVWAGNIDRAHDFSVDTRVLTFTAAVTIVSALLFGLIPAWRTLRADPSVALQRAGRGSTGSARMGKLLIVLQVALSVLLVLAAALFGQSRRNLQTVPLGFHSANLLEMQLMNRPGGYTGMDPNVYYPELYRRLSRVPGVRSVAGAGFGPIIPPFLPDQPATGDEVTVRVQAFRVGPDYFRTLGIPVVDGREFTFQDRPDAPRVAIVSESLARRLFPEASAIGRRIASEGKDLVIAGVVRDSEIGSLQGHNPMQLFTSVYQEDSARQPLVLVRTAGTPDAAVIRELRRQVEAMGREYPLRIQTTERAIDRVLVKERMLASLAAALGLAALLLAAVGIYGLMAYAVTRRSVEIAIRMALGARRIMILRMFIGESLILLIGGFTLSVPAIYAGSKLVTTMLFGFDPGGWAVALTGVAAVLTAVALAAVAIPARRAANLHPLGSLKQV